MKLPSKPKPEPKPKPAPKPKAELKPQPAPEPAPEPTPTPEPTPEPVAQNPEPEPSLVIAPSGAIFGADPLEGRTTRELQLIAQAVGAPAFEHPTHGGLLASLQNYPREAVLQAVASLPEKEGSHPTWHLEKVEGGLHAVSPDGWYAAKVADDGSAVITAFAPPNALNRTDPTPVEGDAVVRVASLAEFVDLLRDLLKLSKGA